MESGLFNHPYYYNIVYSKFFGSFDSNGNAVIDGEILWKHLDGYEYVPQWVVYTAIDDAIGQLNKVQVTGVTAFLEVNFLKPILLNTTSKVVIKITKREQSVSSGKWKTFVELTLGDQAIASSLFIQFDALDFKIQPMSTGKSTEIQRKYETVGPSNKLFKLCSFVKKDSLHAVVTWNDGQGPPKRVHGGVISKPIFALFASRNNAKNIYIKYKNTVPFGKPLQLVGVGKKNGFDFSIEKYVTGFIAVEEKKK